MKLCAQMLNVMNEHCKAGKKRKKFKVVMLYLIDSFLSKIHQVCDVSKLFVSAMSSLSITAIQVLPGYNSGHYDIFILSSVVSEGK